MATLMVKELELIEKLRDMNLGVQVKEGYIWYNYLAITSDFLKHIKTKQMVDQELKHIVGLLGTDQAKDFILSDNGILRFGSRIRVPGKSELRKMILEEGYKICLSIHFGMTKMYRDLKDLLWWSGMKKDVTEFVSSCLVC